MREYNIQLYKMKFDAYRHDYGWKVFKHRYFYKKFKSLSDVAKYIVDEKIFMSPLCTYIYDQLSKAERSILTSKIWAIYRTHHKNAE